jgi:Zn-dependent metalloprotease
MLVRYALGIASLGLATVSAIALMWISFDNVIAWKILGTLAILLGGAWIFIALNSSSAVQVGGPPPPPNNGSQVTYVFDQDLVRFLKFAGSVLALFLILGAFLFGIDLKKTVEVVQKTKEDTQTALHDAQQAGHESQGAELAIRGTKSDITQLVQVSKASAEEIRKAEESARNSEQATRKSEEEIKKHLDAAQGLVNEIRGTRSQARSLLESIGKPLPESVPLTPEQVERLVEVKLLKSFRGTLPPEQYAKLQAQFKSDAVLRREIYDAENQSLLPGKLVRAEGDPATKDPVATRVYDNIGTVHRFFQAAFGRNLSGDIGGPIRATVHYEQLLNNAFWDGRQLVVGDGDGVIFKTGSFGSLSIVASELSHPVIQFSANLMYRDQPGALHTHFANSFAVLSEQWEKRQTADQASWLSGADVLAPGINGVALRSMKAPGTAYDDPKLGKDPQPDHMKNYVKTTDDSGGIHINSGIPDRAFYEVATAIGGNAWEKPGTIWYQTLLRLKPASTFGDCARTTYAIAGELYGKGSKEQVAVKGDWEKVGIEIK